MSKPAKSSRDAMKASTSGAKVRGHQFKVLATNFDCPRCGGKQCVSVKVDATKRTGTVRCREPDCAEVAIYETHYLPKLEKPVDVFYRFFEFVKAEKRTQNNVVRNVLNAPTGGAADAAAASGTGVARVLPAGSSTVLASPILPRPAAIGAHDDVDEDEDDDNIGRGSSTDSELVNLYGTRDQ